MSCNGSVSWSTFQLTSDVFYVSLQRAPSGAPDPKKSRAEQEEGLLKAAEEDAYRQSEKEKDCDGTCDQSDPFEVRRKEFPQKTVLYRWPEEYEGVDATGKTVKLWATYTAVGRANFVKRTLMRECAPKAFGNVAYRLDGLGEVVVDATLLGRLPIEALHGVLLKNGLLEKAEQPVDEA